jgi:uncharacterized protein
MSYVEACLVAGSTPGWPRVALAPVPQMALPDPTAPGYGRRLPEPGGWGVTTRTVQHGQLTYLQIPAVDPQDSARFYARVFGWKIERDYPSFEAPGNLFGQWVTDRPSAPDGGPLLWIAVGKMEDGLREIRAAGGHILEGPSADGPRTIATFRDPGGNAVGIVQEGAR